MTYSVINTKCDVKWQSNTSRSSPTRSPPACCRPPAAPGSRPASGPRSPGSTAATAPEVDGPCFHEARAAMERAKRQRFVFAFGGFPGALDPLASYYSALYWSWTPRQRRAATLLRLGSPADAAARLKVDRSAISHLGRRMAWPLVAAGDKMFRALLETA